MREVRWLTASAVLALLAVGCGGARQLESQWDRYVLPSLARSYSVERMPSAPRPLAAAPVDNPYRMLSEIEERWAEEEKNERAENTAPRGGNDDDWQVLLRDGWGLETAKELVLIRNPGLQAANMRLQAEVDSLGQVEALDAVLKQYAALTDTVMPGVGPVKGRDPIQMQFPFPGITALKGQIAEQNIRAASASRNAVRRDVLVAMEKAFWDLHFIHEATRVARETLELFNHLEGVANTRYESGKTSYQDVVKVRIRLETLQEDLKTWEARRSTSEARIVQLIALETHLPLGKPAVTVAARKLPDLDTLVDAAVSERQELRRMRAVIEKMERMVAMAETMILPAFGPDLSRFENRPAQTAGSGSTREAFPARVTVQQGAGLPKAPWFGTQDAYLRETRQRLAAMRRELADAEAETAFNVRKSWQALDQAVREERLYRESIESLTKTSLDVTTREYETGKISFAEVIDSHSMWLQTELDLAGKYRDIGRSWAELKQWTGGAANGPTG